MEEVSNGRPGGLSSDDGAASVSTLRASIPDAQYEAMRKVYDPMVNAIKGMSAEEAAEAMRGFYAASETNCPWYAFALKHQLPPMISLLASEKDGWREAWGLNSAQAIEARRAETGTGSVHESAVGNADASKGHPDTAGRE